MEFSNSFTLFVKYAARFKIDIVLSSIRSCQFAISLFFFGLT